MRTDNRFETARLKIFYMLMLGIIFSLSAYYFFEKQASIIYIILAGVFVLIYIFFLIKKSDYLYAEFTGDKLIVRYYTAHPFLRKYKALEIPKSYFYDYEIYKTFGGLRKFVRFTVKTPKGKGKYPPISISLYNKKQEKKLREILDKIKK